MDSGRVDLVHVCYGGEGGQLAAAQTLARGFTCTGLRSGAVALGPAEVIVSDPRAWVDMAEVHIVPLRSRGDISSMLGTAKAIRAMRPRVVLCHSHRHAPAAFLGQLLSGRRPRMLVVEHHSIPLRSRMDNFRSAIALALSRGVALLSLEYQEAYPLRRAWLPGARRQFIVPNGVDLTLFPRNGAKTNGGGRDGRIILGMASRLVPSKQHDVLIRALALLRSGESPLDAELRIAGEGPTADQLRELSRDLGVADRVTFLGHVEGDDLISFFRELDIYTHGTLGEGLSIALLEAAAAALPIVASDVVGVHGIFVNGETAVLVPDSDAGAMATGIQVAADTFIGPAIGRRAREMVELEYSSEVVVRGYLEAMGDIDRRGPWARAATGSERI